ncbi:MAG: hypothetical protein LW724_10360 [Planctomycetaceae bacterium]|nr:hypothetical protein [Planctomycetaceae bacterium]
MALETVFREDRSNISIEGNLFLCLRQSKWAAGQKKSKENQNASDSAWVKLAHKHESDRFNQIGRSHESRANWRAKEEGGHSVL